VELHPQQLQENIQLPQRYWEQYYLLGFVNRRLKLTSPITTFNQDCYNVIKAFQGERNVTTPLHLRNLHALGDGAYS